MPYRRTRPYYFLYVIACLQSNRHKGRVSQIEAALTKACKGNREKASKIIKSLIQDGMIVEDSKDNGALRLAIDGAIKPYHQDLYCFECFLPGELVKCRDCTRAFHVSCARRFPECPNYIIQKSNAIAAFDDDEGDTSNAMQLESVLARNRVRPCYVRVQRTRIASVKNTELSKANNDRQTSDEKPEVLCIGEVRPPTRQRNLTENSSMKCDLDIDESQNADQINSEKEFCTFCRLLKAGKNLQPPILDATEMCHLLKYTFKRNRAWIKHDIFKQFENMKLSKKSIAILVQNLFPNRGILSLDTMQEKINFNHYNLLNELLADITEFQYALGVLFGSDHVDFDCSKFLFRDILYDIKEIRRCPDCYRHSNDRITPFWFAFPCVQRHELVFAKCTGHAYWPAKVVRVLQKADKYDVRFFGGNHERALVDKNLIRPIDATDVIKPKSATFKKAMSEMMCYQALEARSLEKFSFHTANKTEIEQILKTVMSAIDANMGVGVTFSKRRKTIAGSSITEGDILPGFSTFIFEDNSSNLEGSFSEPRTPTPNKRREANRAVTLPAKRLRRAEESVTISPATLPTVEMPTSTTAITKSADTVDDNALLRLEIENLKRQIQLQKREIVIAKRKSYCFKCLKPAVYICCISASYCSEKCQSQHWLDGHKASCSHRSTITEKQKHKKDTSN